MKNVVDATTWNDSLSSALRAFKLGDLDLAEQRLDKAFASGGDDIPYLHLLAGHIAHARGALAEAEKAWIRVHEIEPGHAEAWNNLGVLYRLRGDDAKALAAFQEAVAIASDRPDIHYNIGNLHKSAGRFDEAIAAYNKAIEVEPAYAPAYNNLGTLYENRRERGKALEVFKRGLSADKGDASIRFNMGLVLQEEQRWEEARDAFDQALKSRPGWVPGLNNLGIVLQEMGREDEAARTFRNLLEIDPDNVSALNNLGVAYDRLGRSEDARKYFRKALDEEPDYVKAALNLHDSFSESQQLNEALEEINKQITHHPRDPDIRVRMGRTLMGLTRWDEAERSLDHVLERIPDHRDALRAKAELFLATRRPDEAEATLKRLPHDPDVVRDLARLNISTDRPDTAERLLGELIAVNPDDAESRRLLAGVLAAARPEEAAELREEAADADPGNTDDLISLAELYGRTGSRDKALAKLDEAVNLLGARGEAEDLDALNEVLGLYEKAAEALGDEKGGLFTERTAQLGRKLQSAIGRPGDDARRSGRVVALEIPLDEEDALSLLDLNAMEPVIRINEEEETVYLDEDVEDLEDAWTELSQREALRDEVQNRPGGGSGTGPAGLSGVGGDGGSSGPPVHIHLPAQAAGPVPPQVIYQDIRPVTRETPPVQDPPVPEIIVEEIIEEEIPILEEELLEKEPPVPEPDDSMELMLEEEPDSEESEDVPAMDDEGDDDGFFVPESDALSEDLPNLVDPVLPDADLVFTGDESEDDSQLMMLEEADDELVLVEDFESIEEDEVPDPEPHGDPVGAERSSETGSAETAPMEDRDAQDGPQDGNDAEKSTSNKIAGMFKYLSNLTDDAVGEGRQQLIEKGIPLKLAGLHARLSGEPNLREVAQKYDRRRRERHNIELDEDKIRDSLNAFKDLAEAYPTISVRESLSQKLGHIMAFVGKNRNPDDGERNTGTERPAAPMPTAEDNRSNGSPAAESSDAGVSDDAVTREPPDEDDYAAVLPPFDD